MTVAGGTPPYTFSWNTGQSTNVAYNLCVGTSYFLTVTDACGNTVGKNFVFPQASALTVTTGQSPSCLASCNGTAYAYLTGGIPPYLYAWSNGQVGTQINNVCSQTLYTVTVTDACNSSNSANAYIQLAPQQSHTVNHSSLICPLQCNGFASISSTGGTPPFVYFWSSGATTQTANGLCPDIAYQVIVLDPGCTVDTLTFTIPANQISTQVQAHVNNDCYYNCTGSIDLGVTGGSPPFTYAWSNGTALQDPSGLCEGTYYVTVTDPGCSTDTLSFSIAGPLPTAAAYFIDDTLTCSVDCDAMGMVVVTGGVPPFNYMWSNGVEDSVTATLCFGDQFVIVEDPGCYTDTFFFNVASYSVMQSAMAVLTDATCFDTCNGSGAITVIGGVMPYVFSWSDGSDEALNEELCFGISYVSVTDSLGCVIVDQLFIGQPDNVIYQTEIVPSHCENPDGHIVLHVDGGTQPYSIDWSTGSTDTAIYLLTPGTYGFTVTDAHGCVHTDSAFFLGLYPQLVTNNDTTILLGSITNLWVEGANVYQWWPGFALNCDTCPASLAAPFHTMTYCVIGTDEWGCMDTACVRVVIDIECGNVEFPNAFTPNGDGRNDRFKVVGHCIDEYHLVVYNRWGQKVFEAFDPMVGWDGTFRNKDAEVGVYSFKADVLNLLGQRTVTHGNVTLLR